MSTIWALGRLSVTLFFVRYQDEQFVLHRILHCWRVKYVQKLSNRLICTYKIRRNIILYYKHHQNGCSLRNVCFLSRNILFSIEKWITLRKIFFGLLTDYFLFFWDWLCHSNVLNVKILVIVTYIWKTCIVIMLKSLIKHTLPNCHHSK